MLKRVMDLLGGRDVARPLSDPDDLQFAVAALLVEAARMDSDFNVAERATIKRLLAGKFGLAPEAADQLIETADQSVRHATQLFPFTRVVCQQMDADARTSLIEMLWKVAFTDGVLDPHEDMLVRRIAGLIHVPDRERAQARQNALAKLAVK